MYSRYFILIVFMAGLGAGWFGKTWLEPIHWQIRHSLSEGTIEVATQDPATRIDVDSVNSSAASASTFANSNKVNSSQSDTTNTSPPLERPLPDDSSTSYSIVGTFHKLLENRLYDDAMVLYQEQKQQNEKVAIQLRSDLIDQLKRLKEGDFNRDFSELIESYLTIYYDDIDVLLLQAEFHAANSSHLEVVDVYLRAKTYAYSDTDQEEVVTRFNNFVEQIDSSHTSQKNWGPLIGLYSHISTAGLMTSALQYRQALAHLRSGDEFFAVEQLNQLLDDSLMGEAAAITLKKISSSSEMPATIDSAEWEGAESIALQKTGNQYSVSLSNSSQDSVDLLIDTGASMTAMSRESFNTLNAYGDAVEQERRNFRTAGGVISGTVFSVPELTLGPYLLKNTQIAVIDFDSARDIDGLLGMNILGQFRFQIDQEKSRLHLSRK